SVSPGFSIRRCAGGEQRFWDRKASLQGDGNRDKGLTLNGRGTAMPCPYRICETQVWNRKFKPIRRGLATMNIKPYTPRAWKSHPPYLYEPYGSSVKRAPLKRLVPIKQTLSEITGPIFGQDAVRPGDDDLTRNAATDGEAMGERLIIVGRILDEDERPVP